MRTEPLRDDRAVRAAGNRPRAVLVYDHDDLVRQVLLAEKRQTTVGQQLGSSDATRIGYHTTPQRPFRYTWLR
jgi:hypothetical protein